MPCHAMRMRQYMPESQSGHLERPTSLHYVSEHVESSRIAPCEIEKLETALHTGQELATRGIVSMGILGPYLSPAHLKGFDKYKVLRY